ncbi:MAG: hypothetical protein WDM88_01985 [Galbitalea sp.]
MATWARASVIWDLGTWEPATWDSAACWGSSGTGITPGILGVAAHQRFIQPAGGDRPAGRDFRVGRKRLGLVRLPARGTSSGSDLLDVTATAGGLNGSVKVGGSAPASGSSGSSGGSTTSTGSNLLNGSSTSGRPPRAARVAAKASSTWDSERHALRFRILRTTGSGGAYAVREGYRGTVDARSH